MDFKITALMAKHLSIYFLSVTTVFATFANAELVGSIKGAFKVQEGAASYSVPIGVPPGVAQMQPQISLNYRSGRSASIMGDGWSLGGLSSIQRCRANIAEDGYQSGISYTNTDRFCLNGRKLQAVSGVYGASGTQYRTDIDTFSKVVSYGVAGSGPKSFKVWTKSGRVMEYGNTTDARVSPQDKAETLTWLVNKSSDKSNNSIDYSYNNFAQFSDYSIREITYAGNKVSFEYSDISAKAKLKWLADSPIKKTQRLESISTYASNQASALNTWFLAYQPNSDSHIDHLISLQQCTPANCLPKTQFDWLTIGAAGINASSKWIDDFGANNSLWNKAIHPLQMADVNGDGRPDIVAFGDDSVQVSLSENDYFAASSNWISAFGANQGWQNGRHPRMLADVNGDGLPDIVGFYDDGVHVALSTGNGFASKRRWVAAFGSQQNWDIAKSPRTLVDVNSDGRADVLGYALDGVYVALSQGDTFAAPVRYLGDLSYNQGWRSADHIRSLSDVNGDGYVDIIAVNDANVFVALGTGTSFAPKVAWSTQFTKNNGGWDKEKHPRKLIDINADGLADLVGYSNLGLEVALSTGTRFAPSSLWSNDYGYTAGWRSKDHQRMIVDINGDGLVDLVGIKHDGVNVSYGSGFDFSSAQVISADFQGTNADWSQRTLADVNGDGLLDIIGFNANGVNVATMAQTHNATRGRSLLSTITDGFGRQSKVRYTQMTNAQVYSSASDSFSYPMRNVMRASFLVEQAQTNNGIGTDFVVSYRYGGAVTDLSGRGYQGFAWIEQTNQDLGLITTNHYQQQFPFTGMLKRSETALQSGVLINSNANTYAQVSLNAGSTVFPYLASTVAKKYQLTGELVSTSTSEYSQYDNQGNLGQHQQTISGGGKSFITRDNYVYHPIDTNNWLLSLVDQHTQTNSGTNRVTATTTNHYNYDSRGLLISETLQKGAQLALSQSYVRDSFGNVTSTTLSGNEINSDGSTKSSQTRSTKTQYDTNGLFPVRIENALGHIQTTTFEPSYGNLVSQSDANGLTTSWLYDELGRKREETRPNLKKTHYQHSFVNACSDAPANAVRCFTSTPEGETPVTFYYDSLGRELRSRSTGFDGRQVFIDKVYNAKGQLQKTSRAYYANDRTYWAEFTYDALGRIISESQPASNGAVATTTTEYLGLIAKVTNAKQQLKTTTSNVLGQIEHLQDPLGASIDYSYDSRGNLLTTRDDQGNTIVLSYDQLGNKISMQDPDKGDWQYRYNAFGELVYQSDAKGQTTALEYDILGRMIQRTEPGTTPGASVVSRWEYDTQANGIGLLGAEYGPNNFSKTYHYDTLSRPASASTELNDGAGLQQLSVRNEYDEFSRLHKQYRPGAKGEFVLEHQYNPQGFLESVRSPKELVGEFSPSHLTQLISRATEEAATIIAKAESFEAQVQSYFNKADYYRSLSLIVTPISDNSSSIALANETNHRIYTDSAGNQYLRQNTTAPAVASTSSETANANDPQWVLIGAEIPFLVPASSTQQQPPAPQPQQDQFALVQQLGDGSWQISNSSIDESQVTISDRKAYVGDFDRNNSQDLIIVTDGHPAGQHLAAAASSLVKVNRDKEIAQRKALLAQAAKVLQKNGIDIADGEMQLFYNIADRKRYIRLPHATRSGGVRMLLGTTSITPITMPVMQFIELALVNGQYQLVRGTDTFADPDFDSRFIATGESIYIGDNNSDGTADLAVARPAEYHAFEESEILGIEFFVELGKKADVVEAVAVFLQKQANDYLQLADNILVLAETSYRQANTLNLWVDNYQQFDLNADYVTFWQAKKRDAEGRLSHSVTGSGLSTTRNYDPATGQLLDIQTGFFYSQKIRDLEYRYDLLNNLSYRADLIQDVREDFAYDALDRLTYASTTSTLMGSIEYNRTLNYQYDTLGNITDKTGVGSMQYGAGGAGPHAVTSVNNGTQFSYDANGNMLTGNGRTIRYNGADQAYQLSKGSSTVNFSYAADRSRYLKTSAASKTLYLDKIYERVTDLASGEISHKNMIYADGKLVATNVETVTGAGNVKAATTRYMHYDPLGSIDMITGPRGEVVDRLSYDPFGARRPGDWKADGIVTLETFSNRGFTGHEHIDEIGLIHMNGRVYDAELGRFLSADRYIQAPGNSQSFNRYSYVWNKPLKYTDPSGWEIGEGDPGWENPDNRNYEGSFGSKAGDVDRWHHQRHFNNTGPEIPDKNFNLSDYQKLIDKSYELQGEHLAKYWDTAPPVLIGTGAIGAVVSIPRLVTNQGGKSLLSKTKSWVKSLFSGRPDSPKADDALSIIEKSAEAAADAAKAAGKQSGAAAELQVGDRVFTGVSGETVPHSAEVTGALMGTPKAKRADWHGGCAETACLDKAFNAKVDPSGGTIRAINIGDVYGAHKSSKKVCSSCSDVLDHFNVKH